MVLSAHASGAVSAQKSPIDPTIRWASCPKRHGATAWRQPPSCAKAPQGAGGWMSASAMPESGSPGPRNGRDAQQTDAAPARSSHL